MLPGQHYLGLLCGGGSKSVGDLRLWNTYSSRSYKAGHQLSTVKCQVCHKKCPPSGLGPLRPFPQVFNLPHFKKGKIMSNSFSPIVASISVYKQGRWNTHRYVLIVLDYFFLNCWYSGGKPICFDHDCIKLLQIILFWQNDADLILFHLFVVS